MSIFRRIFAIFSALVLALGISLFTIQPAAAQQDMIVCNSADSNNNSSIVTDDDEGHGSGQTLDDGECSLYIYNLDDNVRVWVFWNNSHAYKIKPDGGSYGPCHEINKPDPDFVGQISNPPNSTVKVYYKTYTKHGCVL